MVAAKQELTVFENSTLQEQQQMLNYLNNPQQQAQTVQTKVVFAKSKRVGKKSHRTYVRAVGTEGVMKLGKTPAVTIVRLKVRYLVKGGKIKKVLSTSAYVERNLNPLVSVQKQLSSSYIARNKVYSRAVFSYTLGIGKFGIHLGNIYLKVVGNSKGNLISQSAVNKM